MNMRPARATTGLALATMLVAAPAAADCTGEILSVGLSPTLDYDPFAAVDAVEEHEIRIRNDGDAGCSYRLAFHRSPADPAWLGGLIEYELTDNGSTSLLIDEPNTQSPSRFLAATDLDSNEEAALRYWWRIERGQTAGQGSYGDTVELRLFAEDTGALVHVRQLQPSAEVEAIRSINLAGSDVSSPYNHSMDFGVLTTGANREIQVQVRSNEPYRLSFTSQHGGVLELDGREGWTIPYAVTLNGSLVTLPSQSPTFESSPIAGHSWPFAVTIGDVSGRRAGTYRDEITIQVEPAS